MTFFKYKNECYKELEQVIILIMLKKVYFFQFCADISKKSKSKAIYIDGSERSCYTISFLTIISVFENSQNSLLCGPPWCILVCKISSKSYRFGQLIIFLYKVDILRLLKSYIMFCLQRVAKKKVSAHGLLDTKP